MQTGLHSVIISIMQLVAAIVTIFPAGRRSRYRIVSPACACLFVVVSIFCTRLVTTCSSLLFWLITELLTFLLLSVFVGTTVDLNLWGILCLTNWARIVYQLAFTVALLFQYDDHPSRGLWNTLSGLAVYAAIYILVGAVCRNRMTGADVEMSFRQLAAALCTSFPINLFNHIMFERNHYDVSNQLLVFSTIFAYTCCLFALYLQRILSLQARLANELALVRQMWQQSHLQYEMSNSNIELLNRKTHDLMHHLSNLYDMDDPQERHSYLDSLSHSLVLYDSFLQTGNKALDTILTEKNLYCQTQQIHFKCMADGSGIGFMDAVDIYSILNHTINRAIVYLLSLDDPEKRILSVKVCVHGNLLSISVENYYEPQTENGSEAAFRHTIDTISHTVDRYNGNLSISTENNRYTVSILIPASQKQ